MLFNSFEFLFFFPIVTAIYFLLPHKFRWFHLLVASCIFYMAFIPVYIFILLFTIVIDYFAGIMIENAEGKKRKYFLILSIVANVGVLCVFKYYNFFVGNMDALLHLAHINTLPIPYLYIILPLGLSFHTFQAMSYTIEVYRGNQKAERHFGIYALYVMFYPQLVAGPIERPQNLIHQFHEKHMFDYQRVVSGLKLMAWGMFQKVVIADRLARVADNVFDHSSNFQGLALVIGVVFFTFQIYCDFAGYSDIAIGAAQVMGFDLMKNFNNPFQAKTIAEFWNRWHISLTTWFRDYIFYPLSISFSKRKGNRALKLYINVFLVFLISGLWHGANWTYVVWGGLHGLYLVFATITRNRREGLEQFTGLSRFPALSGLIDKFLVFSLVCLAMIFFRAKRISIALNLIPGIFKGWHFGLHYFSSTLVSLGIDSKDFYFSVLLIFFLEAVHYYQEKRGSMREFISLKPPIVRWAIYYSLLFTIMFWGVYEHRQFIYFQF